MSTTMDSAYSIGKPDARRRELVSLLEKAATDDQASLKTLYECTSAKLYGICLRLLGNEAEAQEVLQEVYLTVWRKAASFDPSRASPITWLATIARNRSIDRLRVRRAPTEDLGAAADIPDGTPSSFQLLGGLGRLVGAIEHGSPTGANRSAFGMELVVVPLLLIWLGRIERSRAKPL